MTEADEIKVLAELDEEVKITKILESCCLFIISAWFSALLRRSAAAISPKGLDRFWIAQLFGAGSARSGFAVTSIAKNAKFCAFLIFLPSDRLTQLQTKFSLKPTGTRGC